MGHKLFNQPPVLPAQSPGLSLSPVMAPLPTHSAHTTSSKDTTTQARVALGEALPWTQSTFSCLHPGVWEAAGETAAGVMVRVLRNKHLSGNGLRPGTPDLSFGWSVKGTLG